MMTLISMETTPNPNSMKLNLSDPLGVTGTFTPENQASASDTVHQLLRIEGVVSVYTAAGFLTLNRDPRMDWQPIMDEVQRIFTDSSGKTEVATLDLEAQRRIAEKQGQVHVWVQTFRRIPIQVKVTDGITEERMGLSERFGKTARELQDHFGSDYLKERHWADWGVRYGKPAEVAHEVAEEIESLMDEARLAQEKQLALGHAASSMPENAVKIEAPPELQLHDSDWHERLQAVQQLDACEETLSLLIQALHDEKPQIRRWAAAKLAGIKTAKSVEALSETLLNDSNVGVRRTAGDSLSDLGDVSAQEAACEALFDNNKLVRWRAARFLSEVGTDAALSYLEKAKNDPEYEVRLEVEAAIKRIRENAETALPVWKLMSQET